MSKIITVVGARPQFIKAAAFSRALSRDHAASAQISELLVHTGQHFDANMSDVFFEELGIPQPAVSLGIGGGSHGQASGRMLEGLERVMQEAEPDMVLVYGDTNSTLAGALAAAKLHIPVVHVEAGLRSYNRRMPEEINRVVTDHVSTLLLCPSKPAADILGREGITDGVSVVGDFMYDIFSLVSTSVEPRRSSAPYALLTLHRAETTDDLQTLKAYIEGAGRSGVNVLFPVHPRTRQALARYAITLPNNIEAVGPLGYVDLVAALKGCDFVMTDSGGLQKEAYFAGRRCLTFRSETEWVELVEAGANRLCPPEPDLIAAHARWALAGGCGRRSIYGDGNAAQKAVQILADWLQAH